MSLICPKAENKWAGSDLANGRKVVEPASPATSSRHDSSEPVTIGRKNATEAG